MIDNDNFLFFATVPLSMEDLLAAELSALGARSVKETVAGVSFTGTIALAYRVCLWSRLASRVLFSLHECEVDSEESLYAEGLRVPWTEHMDLGTTFAIDCSVSGGVFTHSNYAALKLKDALCDHFREKTGSRPDVETENPALRINLHIDDKRATISIDLSGESLHRRGYRKMGTEATLKENAAAAVLVRAGWKEIAGQGRGFLDPMCGSGTLPIEAALMAGDIAPGLSRARFGFSGWKNHSADTWKSLVAEAGERRRAGIVRIPRIVGWDRDWRALDAARTNAAACGLSDRIIFEERDVFSSVPASRDDVSADPSNAHSDQASPIPADMAPASGLRTSAGDIGLIAVDPPYGVRLEPGKDLGPFYENLGRTLRDRFPGSRLAVLAGSVELAKATGLRAYKTNMLYNGRIKCTLACFEMDESSRFIAPAEKRAQRNPAGREMLKNRLTKNMRHLKKWLAKEGITCYRVYDRDMPEYAVSVDCFENKWLHVQEFAAPPEIDPRKAADRLLDVGDILAEVFGIGRESIFIKTKKRQKGTTQYDRLDSSRSFEIVSEGGHRFFVNFTDYLDAGIFLDHRMTRAYIREKTAGARFLNLFGYTGTATVYAAKGGALSTVTVDTSASYLDWASRNFNLNRIDLQRNHLVKDDVFGFLEHDRTAYGLIFCDVPTFSNTKKKDRSFSVQEDHARLIRLAIARLAKGGELLFSTNFAKFKIDLGALSGLDVCDITAQTLPKDFERNRKVHTCYRITVAQTPTDRP